jgi:peptide-methionine (S)-S-oxide reductase
MTSSARPAHTIDPAVSSLKEATLAGGCFWCLDAVFSRLEGVAAVECGYSNGADPHPTYERVCSGTTGHAEVVRLRFDPRVTSYRDVLGVFFSIHDPTTLNRQGADVGTQYRSGIYTHDDAQAREAAGFIAELEQRGVFDGPIVTEVAPVSNYHRAEDYHQRYFEQHPHQGYCAAVIAPKVQAFRREYAARLKPA